MCNVTHAGQRADEREREGGRERARGPYSARTQIAGGRAGAMEPLLAKATGKVAICSAREHAFGLK